MPNITFKRINMVDMGMSPNHCPYCNEVLNANTATADHIIPLSKGGAERAKANLLWACATCNYRIKKASLYMDAQWREDFFVRIPEGNMKRLVIKDPTRRREYINDAAHHICAVKKSATPSTR